MSQQDDQERVEALVPLTSAGCAVCGVTRFILAYPDDPFAVDRHTAQGVFRMACEHCAMTRERDQWRDEVAAIEATLPESFYPGYGAVKRVHHAIESVTKLQAQLQAAHADLEQQQQATNQAVAREQHAKEQVRVVRDAMASILAQLAEH